MTVRVAYSLCGQTPGAEFEELKSWTALLPMGFGDDMLRFNGLGERITAAMNNNDRPTRVGQGPVLPDRRSGPRERGMSLTMHWGQRRVGRSAADDLRAREQGSADRAACAGRSRTSTTRRRRACERMKALGVGWTVQDAMYFGGEQFVQQAGAEAARRVPPVVTGEQDRRRRSAPAPTRIASPPTIRSPRCSGSSTARPSAASRFADRRRRRAAPTRCASTRWAARGSRATSRSAARSKSASSPTSPCCPRTT